MEALWNLEDKWKLTTKDAVVFLACTSVLVTSLFIATILYKKTKTLIHDDDDESRPGDSSRLPKKQELTPRWDCVKTMLMSKVRWSRVIPRDITLAAAASAAATSTLLVISARYDEGNVVGMGLLQSHNSTSAVWQRPILMGEKCELPRFSGLILYDETGRPLQFPRQQEGGYEASGRTTLKDLL